MEHVPASMAERLARAGSAFPEGGLESARIEDIAEATGIPRATLYYHFRSKENVLSFLLRSMLDEAATAVDAAVSAPGTAVDRLRGLVEAHLRSMAANPATARLLVGNLTGAGALTDIAAAVQRSFREPLARVIADGVAEGSFCQPLDVERTVSALFGAVVVAGLRELITTGVVDVGAVAEAVMVLVVGGIGLGTGRSVGPSTNA